MLWPWLVLQAAALQPAGLLDQLANTTTHDQRIELLRDQLDDPHGGEHQQLHTPHKYPWKTEPSHPPSTCGGCAHLRPRGGICFLRWGSHGC